MKTPEEYLKFIEFVEVDASEAGMFYFADNLEKGELIRLIKQVQKDAWNGALDKAAENAEVEIIESEELSIESLPGYNRGEDIVILPIYGVDSNSILKLKL